MFGMQTICNVQCPNYPLSDENRPNPFVKADGNSMFHEKQPTRLFFSFIGKVGDCSRKGANV